MEESILIKQSFRESLKFKENSEKLELLRVQGELEKDEITLELAQKLTQHLNKEQKRNLIELYKNQIKELEDSIENYKKKIIKIRNKINK